MWDALTEYPEAKTILMQKGQEMLRKDNLLDEEVLKKSKEQNESLDQRVSRIDASLVQISTRLARLIGEFGASQAKVKRRLTKLEDLQQLLEYQSMEDAAYQADESDRTRQENEEDQEDEVADEAHVVYLNLPERRAASRHERSRLTSLSSLDSNFTCATLPSSKR